MSDALRDSDYVAYVRDLLGRVRKYAETDAETAVGWARKSAEAMAIEVFRREIGEPGKLMLDELLKRFARDRLVPQHVLLQWGTVQAHGNFGVHAQADVREIDARASRTCLWALEIVMAWFFIEYLRAEAEPQLITDLPPMPRPRSAKTEERRPPDSRPAPWLVEAVKPRVSEARSSRRLVSGGAEIEIGPLTIIVEAPERAPFNPEWTVLEEDTHRVLSAPPVISVERESMTSALAAVQHLAALEVGTIVRRQRTLLAIVHDLSADPPCRPAWIRSALESAIEELRRQNARSVAVPLLGAAHGSIAVQESVALVEEALQRPSALERAWIVVPMPLLADAVEALITSRLMGGRDT